MLITLYIFLRKNTISPKHAYLWSLQRVEIMKLCESNENKDIIKEKLVVALKSVESQLQKTEETIENVTRMLDDLSLSNTGKRKAETSLSPEQENLKLAQTQIILAAKYVESTLFQVWKETIETQQFHPKSKYGGILSEWKFNPKQSWEKLSQDSKSYMDKYATEAFESIESQRSVEATRDTVKARIEDNARLFHQDFGVFVNTVPKEASKTGSPDGRFIVLPPLEKEALKYIRLLFIEFLKRYENIMPQCTTKDILQFLRGDIPPQISPRDVPRSTTTGPVHKPRVPPHVLRNPPKGNGRGGLFGTVNQELSNDDEIYTAVDRLANVLDHLLTRKVLGNSSRNRVEEFDDFGHLRLK
jgi:hypothetical protein